MGFFAMPPPNTKRRPTQQQEITGFSERAKEAKREAKEVAKEAKREAKRVAREAREGQAERKRASKRARVSA